MANERVLDTPAPTDRPTFTILVDGEELAREYQVQAVQVTKTANRIGAARLVLLDGDPAGGTFAVSDAPLFAPGTAITIQAGYHSQEDPIFSGIVVRHGIRARQGKPSTLIVDCKHQAVKLTGTRRSHCFVEMTDSDAFAAIAGNYDLASEFEATAVHHRELVQYGATDWDFLVSRAEANGMLVLTNDERLVTKKPVLDGKPAASLTYGATILRFEAEMDARQQLPGVTSRAWDQAEQAVSEAEAGQQPEVGQGNIDSDTLAQVLGLDTFRLNHAGALSSEELQAWADTQLLKAHLAKIRGSVTCQGLAKVNPGDLIELDGVGDRFNGKAFVGAVQHAIGSGSWTTELGFGLDPAWFLADHDAEPPPAGHLLPAVRGLQIGIVRQLADDPDGEQRVLVTMPLVNPEGDGLWARVATLDAGDSRGSFFLPEIGDEVVLGFVADDPRDPVVVGMLNSSAKPAPLAASDDNHEKGFVTRSKLELLFNDDKKSITIRTPAGNAITVSDDEGALTLADQNGNTVTMNADGITIESAKDLVLKASGDLKLQGMNVSTKAEAKYSAEGATGAEVTTNGAAVLKGSVVQIN